MALETRVAQKEKLFVLLKVKKDYEQKNLPVISSLHDAISYAKAAMEPEDVAYIEKQIEQLPSTSVED